MKYLITEALPSGIQLSGAIMIIPLSSVLNSILVEYSNRMDYSLESMRPLTTGQLHGFLLRNNKPGKKEKKSVCTFRALLKNELHQNEFILIDESSILNDGILEDLTIRFNLTIDILESSVIFHKRNSGTIEYITYSIPNTFLQVSNRVGVSTFIER